MEAIQAFWFAASGVAERIAICPSPPRIEWAMSAITTPMSLKST